MEPTTHGAHADRPGGTRRGDAVRRSLTSRRSASRIPRRACHALALLPLAAACTVSSDQEVAMGRADAARVASEMPLVHDTAVDRFVTTLGRSMASRTSRADLDWSFPWSTPRR